MSDQKPWPRNKRAGPSEVVSIPWLYVDHSPAGEAGGPVCCPVRIREPFKPRSRKVPKGPASLTLIPGFPSSWVLSCQVRAPSLPAYASKRGTVPGGLSCGIVSLASGKKKKKKKFSLRVTFEELPALPRNKDLQQQTSGNIKI